jgi:hypothetical protein
LNMKQHCGKCEIQCKGNNAYCSNYSCACYSGTYCGKCVDINNDDDNCGKCGHKCSKDEECMRGYCMKKCNKQNGCSNGFVCAKQFGYSNNQYCVVDCRYKYENCDVCRDNVGSYCLNEYGYEFQNRHCHDDNQCHQQW